MSDEMDEFTEATRVSIIEDRLESFREVYEKLERKGENPEKQETLEEQIEIWEEALERAKSK